MKVIGRNMQEGENLKTAQGFNRPISKFLELNGSYRIFVPIEVLEGIELPVITAPSVPVRTCSWDALKMSCLPLDNFELTEGNKVIDLSGLDAWARVARVMHKMEAASMKKKAEREAISTASDLGQDVDQIKLSKKLEEIEMEYFGGTGPNDVKISPKKSPVLSGVQIKICTQAVAVRILQTGEPDWKNAEYVIIEFSNKKMKQMKSGIGNPSYCNPDNQYMEYQYDYKGASKQDAGRDAAFKEVALTLSLSETHKDLWEKQGKAMVTGLLHDAEAIANKNQNLSSKNTVQDVQSAMIKYFSMNPGIVAALDFEDEEVRKAAPALYETGVCKFATKIHDTLAQIIAEAEAEENKEEVIDGDEKAKEVAFALSQAPINNFGGWDNMDVNIDEITGNIEDLDSVDGLEEV